MDATKLTAQEQEQEKAKFSFSGATLYGINAVIGSGIFLLPQKIYKGLGPASLAVMLGTALLVILLLSAWQKLLVILIKTAELSNIPKRPLETLSALM